MNLRKKKGNKGFTLVELLVVIAIIAILAAVVVPNAFNAIEKSKVAAAISDYKAIKTAELTYYTDTGKFTDDQADGEDPGFVADPATSPATTDGWDGPYLERWPDANPWGGGYNLVTVAATGKIYLVVEDVPSNAYDRLESQLTSSLVKKAVDAEAASTGIEVGDALILVTTK